MCISVVILHSLVIRGRERNMAKGGCFSVSISYKIRTPFLKIKNEGKKIEIMSSWSNPDDTFENMNLHHTGPFTISKLNMFVCYLKNFNMLAS